MSILQRQSQTIDLVGNSDQVYMIGSFVEFRGQTHKPLTHKP